jgi:hypothetical protein
VDASSQQSHTISAQFHYSIFMREGHGVVISEEFCEKVKNKVQELTDNGFDAKKSWVTALFYTDGSPVRDLFCHKHYGVSQNITLRNRVKEFSEHVICDPTTWFSGPKESKPKGRMLERAKAVFDEWHDLHRPATELVRDALFRLCFCFAHDSKCGKKNGRNVEGGPKMFFMASPWQILNAIPKGRIYRDESIDAINNISWPGSHQYDEKWMTHGQPVLPYPTCSIYASRVDETIPPNLKHEYFMQIDVDGINALTDEQEKRSGKEACLRLCERAVAVFQDDDEGRVAILTQLSSVIKNVFERTWNTRVAVSWHKSVGYKPSWRAFIVGMFFQDNYEAKTFVAEKLHEECMTVFRENLPEPFCRSDRLHKIIDCGTFQDGWDRCLGSAKLCSSNPQDMRFLSVQPLSNPTDASLMTMFNECPNRYILTVLGWMYDESVIKLERKRDDAMITYKEEFPRAVKGKRSRSTGESSLSCSKVSKNTQDEKLVLEESQAKRLFDIVSDSFDDNNIVHPTDPNAKWKGETATLERVDGHWYFKFQAAASDFMVCAYRNFTVKANQDPKPVVARLRANASLHSPTTSVGKINYQILIGDGVKPWIRQNCFKCGGIFGFKMQFLCPVSFPQGVTSLRDFVMGQEKNTTEDIEKLRECLRDVCIQNIRIMGSGGKVENLFM